MKATRSHLPNLHTDVLSNSITRKKRKHIRILTASVLQAKHCCSLVAQCRPVIPAAWAMEKAHKFKAYLDYRATMTIQQNFISKRQVKNAMLRM